MNQNQENENWAKRINSWAVCRGRSAWWPIFHFVLTWQGSLFGFCLFFSINLVIAEFALYCPTDYLFQRSFDKEMQVWNYGAFPIPWISNIISKLNNKLANSHEETVSLLCDTIAVTRKKKPKVLFPTSYLSWYLLSVSSTTKIPQNSENKPRGVIFERTFFDGLIFGEAHFRNFTVWQKLFVCEFLPSRGENEFHPCQQNGILVALRGSFQNFRLATPVTFFTFC